VPVVTRLREDRRGRVAVELDGAPWHTLPVQVVVRSGLAEGRSLDRPALRSVARELRRAEALGLATRALRTRDLSQRELQAQLERRGVPGRAAEESIGMLTGAGLVDDARLASNRAERMAERGYGDAAIRHDLERRGLSADIAEEALRALEPEEDRARRIVAERGAGARTARYLAARGFAAEALEQAAGPDFGHGL
jgi:SOS response regulatory protein OraA/RecX